MTPKLRLLPVVGLLIVVCLPAPSFGYLLGDYDVVWCWRKDLDTHVQELLNACPPGINLQWSADDGVPDDMSSDVTYRIGFNFTVVGFNVTSNPPCSHANLHACRTSTGACTPNVAQTANLVTHTVEKAGAFASDSAVFENELVLDVGEWTIIAHARMVVDAQYQYEVAIGVKRTVTPRLELLGVGDTAKSTATAVDVIASLLVSAVAAFLIRHRKHPVILAASAPLCLAITLAGLVTLQAIPLFATVTATTCFLRPWFLSLGFTGMFGFIVLKNWRLYRIFHNQSFQTLRVSNRKLFRYWLAIAAVDVLLLLAWSVDDPLTPNTGQSGSVSYQYETQCSSRATNLYMGMILGYKAVLIVAGLLLAAATRNLAAEFNETQSITMSVAALVTISVVSVPTLFLFKGHPDVKLIAVTICIALTVIASIFCMFVPKVLHVIVHNRVQPTSDEVGVSLTPVLPTIARSPTSVSQSVGSRISKTDKLLRPLAWEDYTALTQYVLQLRERNAISSDELNTYVLALCSRTDPVVLRTLQTIYMSAAVPGSMDVATTARFLQTMAKITIDRVSRAASFVDPPSTNSPRVPETIEEGTVSLH